MDGDEDEVLEVGTDPNSSPTGQGNEGPNGDDGLEEGDVSAEHVDDEEDGGELEVAPKPPSRAEVRFQRLANEAKAAREEAAEARREAQELRRSQQQASQQVTEAQERERLALMTPEERTAYVLDRSQRHTEAQIRQIRMESAVQSDKVAFDAKAAVHPTYAKYQAEVERQFQEHLAKGSPVEREVLLKQILGERALQAASPAKQRKAAQQASNRVAAQATKPGSAKGDAASQRGKGGDSPEKRLAGQFI